MRWQNTVIYVYLGIIVIVIAIGERFKLTAVNIVWCGLMLNVWCMWATYSVELSGNAFYVVLDPIALSFPWNHQWNITVSPKLYHTQYLGSGTHPISCLQLNYMVVPVTMARPCDSDPRHTVHSLNIEQWTNLIMDTTHLVSIGMLYARIEHRQTPRNCCHGPRTEIQFTKFLIRPHIETFKNDIFFLFVCFIPVGWEFNLPA